MLSPVLTDFDWSLHHTVSASSAHAVHAPLLRLQLFLKGACSARARPRGGRGPS